MPIYAYRCTTCGHAQDVLRKISDPPLSVCPACGAATFVKQVTAAGFQLKGSGWYATDFRGDNKKSKKAADSDAASVEGKPVEAGAANGKDGAKGDGAKGEVAKGEGAKSEPAAAPAPAASSAAAPASAPTPPVKGGT